MPEKKVPMRVLLPLLRQNLPQFQPGAPLVEGHPLHYIKIFMRKADIS